jgi:hemoglobin
MLSARHLPYPIRSVERDQWMGCMLQAMQDEGVEQALMQRVAEALYGTADWMRNRPG